MTKHAVPPAGWQGFDGDKAACGVRISELPGRESAESLDQVECDRCVLRCLRTHQARSGRVLGTQLFNRGEWPW